MSSFLRIALVLIPSLLAGCSLISDFGDITFADSDGGGDGDGDRDSGQPMGGTGADGGGGMGGTGGDTGGTGGSGGTGGVIVDPFMCTPGDDGGCTDCEENTDCTTGLCLDGLCVQCEADSDCAPGVCESNLCVACRVDADCGEDNVCLPSHECVPDRKPSGVWLSGGGGPTSSATRKARISIGTPQPMGRGTSTTLKFTIGAGAGFPQ
jgi:hypothetical protein